MNFPEQKFLSRRALEFVALLILALVAALAAACSNSPGVARCAGATGGSIKYEPSGQEGRITGQVMLKGTPPAPLAIDTAMDPACSAKNPTAVAETIVSAGGRLANVFLYLKDGVTADGKRLADFTFATPAATVNLDQNGCRYVPHVLGLQVNQKLSVTNSDQTVHNIHPMPTTQDGWNRSQAAGEGPITSSFACPEIIPVKCNQHPWMKAYIGVVANPFFAVSRPDGSFEIQGVPPGTYTLVAWHEKLGEKTAQVKVDRNGRATADFEFDAAAGTARRESSLPVSQPMDFSERRPD